MRARAELGCQRVAPAEAISLDPTLGPRASQPAGTSHSARESRRADQPTVNRARTRIGVLAGPPHFCGWSRRQRAADVRFSAGADAQICEPAAGS